MSAFQRHRDVVADTVTTSQMTVNSAIIRTSLTAPDVKTTNVSASNINAAVVTAEEMAVAELTATAIDTEVIIAKEFETGVMTTQEIFLPEIAANIPDDNKIVERPVGFRFAAVSGFVMAKMNFGSISIPVVNSGIMQFTIPAPYTPVENLTIHPVAMRINSGDVFYGAAIFGNGAIQIAPAVGSGFNAGDLIQIFGSAFTYFSH